MLLRRFAGKFRSSTTRSMTTSFASWTLSNEQTSLISGGTPGPVFLKSLHIEVSSIASSAANLIVKVTRDSAGDFAVVPVATGSIVTGQDSATNGAAIFSMCDVPTPTGYSTLYLWVKTDAGTCTGTVATLVTEPASV